MPTTLGDGAAIELSARFAFVLEQTLGHVAHSRNLERALGRRPDIDATLIRLRFESDGVLARLPVLGSWSLRASWMARAALARRLRAGPLDAVFIHTQVASLLADRAMAAAPTVVSLDATPENFDREGGAYGHGRGPGLLEDLKLLVHRRALARASAIVTWNRWARTSLVERYGIPVEKVTVVHPGVDLDLFRPADSPRSSDRLRILFVGGDFARKGGFDLLQAVSGLRSLVELDLVTGSPVPVTLRHPELRVWHGLEPQSADLVTLFRQADVFVLPSRGDCFPQAVAEALACGLPVVASRVGAVEEMVRDDLNGFLVRPGSPGEIRAAILALLSDPGRRRAMGGASLAIARRDHDAWRNWKRIFELMQQCGEPTRVLPRT